MKKGSFKWLLVVMMVVAFAFAAVGCTQATIEITSAGEVMVNQTLTLTAQVKKGDNVLTDATVTWEVANKEGSTCNATITDGNKLKATATGTVIVTAKSEGATTITKEITVKEDAAQTAADKFKADHSTVLGKTATSIAISDKTAVNAALSAYNALSADAKALLASQKTLLDSLSTKIAQLEEEAALTAAVNKFKSDNTAVLALTAETVAISDRGAVEAVLSAYNALAANVKAQLTAEKAKLDALLVAIAELEAEEEALAEKEAFVEEFEAVLALTAETVAVGDKAAVEEALEALEALSEEVQILLAEEQANLEALLVAIGDLEAKQAFIEEFETVLALTTGNVALTDKAAVEDALAAYAKLSAEAKDLLKEAKANLDALKERIAALQVEYDTVGVIIEFRSTYKEILDKHYAGQTPVYKDEAVINAAIAKYNTFNSTIQLTLYAEKVALDALKANLTTILGTNTFRTTHAAALAMTKAGMAALSDWDAYVDARTKIQAALNNATTGYSSLNAGLQAYYAAEKTHLDELVTEYLKVEIKLFDAAFKATIALDVTKITIANSDAITKMFNAYNTLQGTKPAAYTDSAVVALYNKVVELKVADYKNTHKVVLGYDLDIITLTSKTVVEKALTDYAALIKAYPATAAIGGVAVSDAVALLTAEKTLLDSFMTKIAKLEAVAFLDTHHDTFALAGIGTDDVAFLDYFGKIYGTTGTGAEWTKILKSINDARTAYAGLTPSALANWTVATQENTDFFGGYLLSDVTAAKTALDRLYGMVEYLDFCKTHATALAKKSTSSTATTGKVTSADRTIVQAALDAYNRQVSGQDVISAIGKGFITLVSGTTKVNLKAHLDTLIGDINTLDATAFRTAHKTILAITDWTKVVLTNKAATTAARTAYNALSSGAKALLAAENTTLTNIENAIKVLEWKAAYATIFDTKITNVDTVKSTQRATIIKAQYEGNALTLPAGIVITTQLTHLDTLLLKIDELDKVAYLATHKEALKYTTNTITPAKMSSVKAAIKEYESIVLARRANLLTMLATEGIDTLIYDLEAQIQVIEFLNAHRSALSLNTFTVAPTSRDIVFAAWDAYFNGNLTAVAEQMLISEGSLLEDLLDAIEDIEQNNFKDKYDELLTLVSVSDVEIKNKEAIKAAQVELVAYQVLTAYRKPATEAAKFLSAENTHLTGLLNKVAALEYEVAHNAFLELEVDTVEIADEAKINAAVTAYKALTPAVQGYVTTAKGVVTAFADELMYKVTALKFAVTYVGALNTTETEDAAYANRNAIVAALAAYDKLDQNVKNHLFGEYITLDLLMTFASIKEMATFNTTYGTTIAIALSAVRTTDASKVNAAINYYTNNLSSYAQAGLIGEKGMLDTLKAKIDAMTFYNNNNAVVGVVDDGTSTVPATAYDFKLVSGKPNAALVNKSNTVTAANESVVTKAKTAYDALTPAAKTALNDYVIGLGMAAGTNVGTHITSLGVKVTALKVTSAAGSFKTSNKAGLDLALKTFDGDSTATPQIAPKSTAYFTSTNKNSIATTMTAYLKLSKEVRTELAADTVYGDVGEILMWAEKLVAKYNLEITAGSFKTSQGTALKYKLDSTENGSTVYTGTIVAIGNKATVNTALTAYSNLDWRVRDLLTAEKARLDSLLAQIVSLEDTKIVADFNANVSNAQLLILAVTDAKTTLYANRAKIVALIKTMEGYSSAVMAENYGFTATTAIPVPFTGTFAQALTHLKALETTISGLEFADAAASFKSTYSVALGLSVANVALGHKATVTAAITAYDKLAPEVKALLVPESTLLTDLNTKLTALTIEDSVAKFLTAQNAILAKDTSGSATATDPLKYADKAKVTALRTAYDKLVLKADGTTDNDIVTALTTAYQSAPYNGTGTVGSALTTIEARMVVLTNENDAAVFANKYKTIINLAYDKIIVAYKASANAAYAAYDALRPDVQALLNTEIGNINAVIARITELEAENAATLFQTTYKTILELDIANVSETLHRTTINNALNAYDKLSLEAQGILSFEKSIIDSLAYALDEALANEFMNKYDAVVNYTYIDLTNVYADETADWNAVKATNAEAAKDYAKLSEDVQTLLFIAPDFFETLAMWEVIVEYAANHAEALAQTDIDLEAIYDEAYGEDGNPSDWTAAIEAVNAAYTAYKAYGAFVRYEMVNVANVDVTFFENLLSAIDRIETDRGMTTFLDMHAEILAKLVDDIAIDEMIGEDEYESDEPAINAAIADYNAFTSKTLKGLLAIQKELLDSMKVRVELLKAARKTADNFDAKYAKYMVDMSDSDAVTKLFNDNRATIFTDIDAALKALANMNAEATLRVNALGWTDTHFETLLLLVNPLEVAEFQKEYASLISTDLSVISDTDLLALEGAVNAALARYEVISEDAQGLLVAEKTKIDAVKAAIEEIKADDKAA